MPCFPKNKSTESSRNIEICRKTIFSVNLDSLLQNYNPQKTSINCQMLACHLAWQALDLLWNLLKKCLALRFESV